MIADCAPFAGLSAGARVLAAFSGGVDSAVAAYLAKQAGFEVLAVTMPLPDADHFDLARADAAARRLGIPLEVAGFSAEFEEVVMRGTWSVYAAGRTPNPCAVCNRRFKFGRLLELAVRRDCAALVTGHYARLCRGAGETIRLKKAVSPDKDQSYFLFGLSPEQLSFARFPLGGMEKGTVRALAARLNLPCAADRESQDLCFAPADGSNTAEMLRTRFHAAARSGNFVDRAGRILGGHRGIHAYTVGQRKGTGVALGRPAYVMWIDAATGDIVLTQDEDDLNSDGALLDAPHFLLPEYAAQTEFSCTVKIRYRSPAVPAHVQHEGGQWRLIFDAPLRAVTPGQAAVFYDGDTLLGGAWIQTAFRA